MELWHVPLRIGPAAVDRATQVLDASELDRAARFRMAVHRDAYIAAHAALRGILGQALGLAPASLVFDAGPAGKPMLAARIEPRMHFNLSHAGDHALVLLSPESEVGVDLECLPVQGLEELDAGIFSTHEIAAVAACLPEHRPLARLRCWVRKEAVLKAAGCGLSDEVRTLAVSIDEPARIVASAHPQVAAGEWFLAGIERPGEWIGAVAARAPVPTLSAREWRWPP